MNHIYLESTKCNQELFEKIVLIYTFFGIIDACVHVYYKQVGIPNSPLRSFGISSETSAFKDDPFKGQDPFNNVPSSGQSDPFHSDDPFKDSKWESLSIWEVPLGTAAGMFTWEDCKDSHSSYRFTVKTLCVKNYSLLCRFLVACTSCLQWCQYIFIGQQSIFFFNLSHLDAFLHFIKIILSWQVTHLNLMDSHQILLHQMILLRMHLHLVPLLERRFVTLLHIPLFFLGFFLFFLFWFFPSLSLSTGLISCYSLTLTGSIIEMVVLSLRIPQVFIPRYAISDLNASFLLCRHFFFALL